jgi:general secretion pathway protein G
VQAGLGVLSVQRGGMIARDRGCINLRGQAAFTLTEMLAALAIAALLLGVAIPSYTAVIHRQRVAAAVTDLAKLSLHIASYRGAHFSVPPSLADIGAADWRDPWGNPYQYLSFEADIPGIKGKIRKDHNLHPINSEFDLYSMGPDGASRAPLTAKASRDDVIFARDGNFIGPAEKF